MIPKIKERNFYKIINEAIQEGRHANYLKKVLVDYEDYKKIFEESLTDKNSKEDIYCFKVEYLLKKGVWREIEIHGNQNFGELASAIVESMGWDEDHMHGFGLPIPSKEPEKRFPSLSKYMFYCDGWEDDPFPTYKSNQIKIYNIGYKKFPKLEFIFDFGDGHRFDIWLIRIHKNGSKFKTEKFPRVVKAEGVPPEQYPDYDEDEQEESFED